MMKQNVYNNQKKGEEGIISAMLLCAALISIVNWGFQAAPISRTILLVKVLIFVFSPHYQQTHTSS